MHISGQYILNVSWFCYVEFTLQNEYKDVLTYSEGTFKDAICRIPETSNVVHASIFVHEYSFR